jgi:hypothetical protein
VRDRPGLDPRAAAAVAWRDRLGDVAGHAAAELGEDEIPPARGEEELAPRSEEREQPFEEPLVIC